MKYNTNCPYCGHDFSIKTAKTRGRHKEVCYSCKQIAVYSLWPSNGELVMKGTKLK